MPKITATGKVTDVFSDPVPPPKFYLGIDPGEGGGISVLCDGGDCELPKTVKLSETATEVWDWLVGYSPILRDGYLTRPPDVFACIEQQTPRPTNYFDRKNNRWVSTILASTCKLYGSYSLLYGMLVASEIPFEVCPPKRWQSGLHIPPREKGEADSHWKNRLKVKASSLFPQTRVTLWNADSLLIAEYCRRQRTGTL